MIFVKSKHIILFFTLLTSFSVFAQQQSVGLVLSGGGATGFAHIGVIKALEENGIKIDNVSGTSMGAIVGAFYACGYSPDQMLELFTSDNFMKAVKGKYDEKYGYFLRKISQDASWMNLKLTLDSIETSIPSHLVSAEAVELLLIKYLEPAIAKANYNFDSLMVPFRCVAADITNRRPHVFKSGNLSTAVRASMAYPLYFKPVEINGHVMFDGGIYNNFPIDCSYNDFIPDFIIGSNVSYNFEKPTIDNPLSQLRSMIVADTKYALSCNEGVIIKPDVSDISTFSFDDAEKAFKAGYDKTITLIDSIKNAVKTVNPSILEARRIAFRQNLPQLIIDKLEVTGVNKAQKIYITNSLKLKNKTITIDALIPEYFKLLSEDKIRSIFPEVKYNRQTRTFTLHLDVTKEHDLFLGFGGNFSNRPINEGFIGLQYNFLHKLGYTIYANSYFGKLNNSTLLKFRIDFPWRLPFYWEVAGSLNKWDYFRSSTNFFEDIKPAFLIQKNNFINTELGFPVFYKGKIILGASYGNYINLYYQTDNFNSKDTADVTTFVNYSPYLGYEYNSLNYPIYAFKGTHISLKGRFVNGFENTIPGNTNPDTAVITKNTQWFKIYFKYESYFNRQHKLHFGVSFDVHHSNQGFFQNYTASILSAPVFVPIPEAQTYFIPNYRAFTYGAGGLKLIYSLSNRLHLRAEGYIFQPYNRIGKDIQNKAYLSAALSYRYYVFSSAAVYHSPFGPIALNINYYDGKPNEKWSILFHIGYLLFNKNQWD